MEPFYLEAARRGVETPRKGDPFSLRPDFAGDPLIFQKRQAVIKASKMPEKSLCEQQTLITVCSVGAIKGALLLGIAVRHRISFRIPHEAEAEMAGNPVVISSRW